MRKMPIASTCIQISVGSTRGNRRLCSGPIWKTNESSAAWIIPANTASTTPITAVLFPARRERMTLSFSFMASYLCCLVRMAVASLSRTGTDRDKSGCGSSLSVSIERTSSRWRCHPAFGLTFASSPGPDWPARALLRWMQCDEGTCRRLVVAAPSGDSGLVLDHLHRAGYHLLSERVDTLGAMDAAVDR